MAKLLNLLQYVTVFHNLHKNHGWWINVLDGDHTYFGFVDHLKWFLTFFTWMFNLKIVIKNFIFLPKIKLVIPEEISFWVSTKCHSSEFVKGLTNHVKHLSDSDAHAPISTKSHNSDTSHSTDEEKTPVKNKEKKRIIKKSDKREGTQIQEWQNFILRTLQRNSSHIFFFTKDQLMYHSQSTSRPSVRWECEMWKWGEGKQAHVLQLIARINHYTASARVPVQRACPQHERWGGL